MRRLSNSRRTKRNVSVLRSILALAGGAAAMPLCESIADAGFSDIKVFTIGKTVGFGSGQDASYSFSLPGTGNSITVNREQKTSSSSNRIVAVITGGGLIGRQSDLRSAGANPAGVNVAFRTGLSTAKNWNNTPSTRNGAATFGNIIRSSTADGGFLAGPGAFSNKYLLFTFQDTVTKYGWVEMTSATITPGTVDGMSVTFGRWAYQNSGAYIGAGEIGGTAVPEPSSLALCGAFVAGASGLRLWRKRRQTEQTPAPVA